MHPQLFIDAFVALNEPLRRRRLQHAHADFRYCFILFLQLEMTSRQSAPSPEFSLVAFVAVKPT